MVILVGIFLIFGCVGFFISRFRRFTGWVCMIVGVLIMATGHWISGGLLTGFGIVWAQSLD